MDGLRPKGYAGTADHPGGCPGQNILEIKNSDLKLNADNTEFLIIGTSTQRGKFDGFFPTHILYQSITPAASVLNLGVTFNENFNFKQHNIENMSLLFLPYPRSSLYSPVYCNSLLYNTANKDIAKCQRVQFILARVFTRSPRFSRSVPLLKSLHWLPVHYRIIFKICTIAL